MKQHLLNIAASFADLGIILPLVLGMAVATGMNAGFILIGLGVFALVSGLVYRRPIPAQPMKVIAALAIVGQLDQQSVRSITWPGGTSAWNHGLGGTVKKTGFFNHSVGDTNGTCHLTTSDCLSSDRRFSVYRIDPAGYIYCPKKISVSPYSFY
ncbi:MAG: putative sulfate/molybdate transporter [gamma proteobacterium symbiont of Lucinoma myriamae]|nr:putative sulfate/molybdate transporter [gamma proteobacterium symbiont of Lucinoma myriamae]